MFGEGKRFYFGDCDVDKLCFDVVAEVVITKERVCAKVMCNFEPSPLEWLLIQMIADTDSARCDKVHL